ncbi:hypothetical protein K435DRAFT_858927 [Dendrothele bispora CBS 962.96]|uniref:Uncharacterized protein n=1 Tax=Dendrothele bispora (strain CBS 962.96) TaxID=1314807 RepID=A0A4S8M2X2_DENBC|nr:hypothetical protein K435DRAFT_858927 [Dendrothele bispora CBS 962.96]
MIATNAQLVPGLAEDIESNQWTFGQILSIILVANPLVGSWRVLEAEWNVGVGVGKKGNDDDDDLQGREKEGSRKGLGHSKVDKESEMKGIRRVNGRMMMRMRGGSRCEKDQWRCWLWECRGGGGK